MGEANTPAPGPGMRGDIDGIFADKQQSDVCEPCSLSCFPASSPSSLSSPSCALAQYTAALACFSLCFYVFDLLQPGGAMRYLFVVPTSVLQLPKVPTRGACLNADSSRAFMCSTPKRWQGFRQDCPCFSAASLTPVFTQMRCTGGKAYRGKMRLARWVGRRGVWQAFSLVVCRQSASLWCSDSYDAYTT